jgi:tape measure domain-containing protein
MGSQALLIRVAGDTSDIKGALAQLNSTLAKTGASANAANRDITSLGGSLTSLGSKLSLSITAPMLAAGAAVVKAASDMEALKKGLETVATAADPLEAQLKRLKDVAKLPGLGFSEAIQGSVRLQSAGFSANLAERSLKAFGNALATVGKGKAELDGVSLALSQIASKGKISAEEINQLNERVPQIRAAMKAAFGTADTEVLQKAGIGATEFVTKVVVELEKLKQVSGGTKNSLENLGDAIKESAVRIGDKLLPSVNAVIPKLEALATGAADAVDWFLKLPDPIKNTALAMSALAFAAGPAAGIVGNVGSALGAIRVAAGAAGVGMATLFGGAVVAGIAQTLTAIDELKAKTKDYYEYLEWLKSGGKEKPIPGQGNADMRGVRTKDSFAVPDLIGVKDNAAVRLGINLRGISQELGILGDRAKTTAPPVNNLGESLKKAADTTKIVVDSIAESQADKLQRLYETGKISLKRYRQELVDLFEDITNGASRTDLLSKTSLLYVETLERTKSAVGKAKDAMFEYYTAGTPIGKQLEVHAAALTAVSLQSGEFSLRLQALIADMSSVSGENHFTDRLNEWEQGFKDGNVTMAQYEDALRRIRFEVDTLSKMPPLQMATPKPGAFAGQGVMGANNAASEMGFESDNQRQQRIAGLQRNLDLIRAAHKEGRATGTDVAKAQEQYNKGIDEGTAKVHKQSRSLLQVSTIITDLSRSVTNTGFDLLFSRAKVDVSSYKSEIAQLTIEQERLLAVQKKGHNVTAELATVQNKLAEANRKMGEELHKASLGFRSMEAGKATILDLSKAIGRDLIEGALSKLSKKLLDVGGLFGTVFGGGTGVIKSVAPGLNSTINAAGGIGGSIGSGAKIPGISGAASAASSGIMGTVGALASVGSLISGIVGNFQMMGMNKTLDLIEHEVRATKNIVLDTLMQANLYWPGIKDIHERLYELRTVGIKIEGGGSVVNNINGGYFVSDRGLDELLDLLVRRLKQQGT